LGGGGRHGTAGAKSRRGSCSAPAPFSSPSTFYNYLNKNKTNAKPNYLEKKKTIANQTKEKTKEKIKEKQRKRKRKRKREHSRLRGLGGVSNGTAVAWGDG
jgi:hypothetical protein